MIGVRRLRLLDGAREANGHAVIVDVLRAATSVAYALAGGASRIVLVDTADAARKLRRERFPDAVLVGESDGRKIPDFDLDNSPTDIERTDLAERTVLIRTSSGTQGVVAARNADAIYLAGFVNAGATARALVERGARVASLVAMGAGGTAPAEEDEACAALIESLLRAKPLSGSALIRDVRRREAQRWDHPAPTFLDDVERCFALDRFDFAVEVVREDDLAIAVRA